MPKVKAPRQSTSIDMTPMVDMAFLLVTFFILTIQFRPDEPVQIDLPASKIDSVLLPEKNRMIISVSDSGKIFFDMDNKEYRKNLITQIAQLHNINLTDEQKTTFSLLSTFGIPFKEMSTFLSLDPDERKKIPQSGIPVDTTISDKNELADWIMYARISNPAIRIAIKGDKKADYDVIKAVMKTLQDRNITLFNLITNSNASSPEPTSSKPSKK